MEEQQFVRLLEVLEQEIQYLQVIVARLEQLDESIHQVFLR